MPQTTITTPGKSGPAATSAVKVPSAGGDVRRNWQAISQLAVGIDGAASHAQSAKDKIDALKSISRVIEAQYPFRIYSLPEVLRITPDPANDWRKFRVRAGRVMLTAADAIDATGTDGNNACPDDESYPGLGASPSNEYTANANVATHWFWLEINSGGTTVTVKHGDNPTLNGWTAFPVIDALHIPLGVVDTRVQPAVIRQFVRADVMSFGASQCPP